MLEHLEISVIDCEKLHYRKNITIEDVSFKYVLYGSVNIKEFQQSRE